MSFKDDKVIDGKFKEVKDENQEEKEMKEKKFDAGKIVKIIGSVLVTAGAVAGIAFKIFGGKKGKDGYSEVPAPGDASDPVDDAPETESSEEE